MVTAVSACSCGATGAVLGAATLFFGCRGRDQDYIYAAELAGFLRTGALAALHVAFSREGAAKDYVQHHMAREAAVLAELLMVSPCSWRCRTCLLVSALARGGAGAGGKEAGGCSAQFALS